MLRDKTPNNMDGKDSTFKFKSAILFVKKC